MERILPLLKRYFGYDRLRPGQERAVSALLAGQDLLAVMPTGAGKSLCFQLPALAMEGITLVVSPLISLMKDQVGSLVQAGVPAAYLNSSLTPRQYELAMERAGQGRYKLIYVAPERLNTPRFLAFARRAPIALLAVDEAHCVSQWGPDFRPSYLEIPAFLEQLPKRPPVAAFTATATPQVRRDILDKLGLRGPEQLVTGFDRPNLRFDLRIPEGKKGELLRLLRAHSGQSAVVYCSTRKQVEQVCSFLNQNGMEATRYHAGLEGEERRANQDDFLYDRARVMVATNAFGMGIDKSNVRLVVHYNMPMDLESYYQEAGRAGRDGAAADCVLLFSRQDIHTARFLIEHGGQEQADPAQTQRQLERLNTMIGYTEHPGCLRQYILNYFGQHAQPCGNCSNCADLERVEAAAQGRQAVTCVRDCGQRFGRGVISAVLRGAQNESVLRWHLDRLDSYGALAGKDARWVDRLLSALIHAGYLAVEEGDYPTLSVTQRAGELFRPDASLPMLVPRKAQRQAPEPLPLGPADPELFQRLRQVRERLARRRGVPPYVIFSDKTLQEMCRRRPRTPDQLLQVSGVGWKKLDDFGREFLEAILDYEGGEP